LRADAYTLPDAIDCDELERLKKQEKDRGRNGRGDEGDRTPEDWCRELWRRHDRDGFEIPAGWDVQISPAALDLAPGAEQTVTVSVEPPAGFHGSEAINVNAIDDRDRLVGGVTLYVTR
jgi:hypothetical protein